MASDDHANARWHNAKCALVSGLACGFGKQVLMLAHAPHKTAIDYADRLRVHDGATQCRGLAAEWLTATEEVVSSHWRSVRDHESKIRRSAELANLSVGEAVAELEEDELSEYFVETSSYLEALAGRQTIFVGRKGTGKTANMYAIVNRLGSDRRNYICVIKPVDYEVEGILRMLKQSISVSEKGYLVESLWKYLIYTEIAMDVFHDLQSRPEHYRPSAGEQQLLTFVTDHVDLIMPPFSVRLQSTIEKLCDLEGVDPGITNALVSAKSSMRACSVTFGMSWGRCSKGGSAWRSSWTISIRRGVRKKMCDICRT
jgi:hypothetical protein